MRTRVIRISTIFPLLLIIITGCSSSSDTSPNEAEIVWGECPVYINTQGNAECAFITVPVDYERPFDETIDLFIWRIRGASPDSEKKGNLWLIMGGPGESSVAFSALLPPLAAAYPDWDYYSMDHRGVGNSNCLECPMAAPDSGITPENAAACYDEVQVLHNGTLGSYNVTNAAKDLHTVISRTSGLRKTFVYGVSYGTYLVQRFMTLYPDSVEGVIIDSIVPADSRPLDNYDSSFNDVGRQIMQQCRGDDVCSGKLSEIASDPWQAMETVFGMIDDESLCSDFSSMTRKDLRNKLAALSSNMYGRALIPAVMYRLCRCNESDKAAIAHLFSDTAKAKAQNEEFKPVDKLNSSVVFENIAISELCDDISPEAAQEIVDAAYVSEDIVPDLAGIKYNNLWPAYDDPFKGIKPEYYKPVLMINSTVDGPTPLSLALGVTKYLHGPCHYFVAVPWAAHGAVFQSPVEGKLTPIDEMTGLEIMMEFISDPFTEPDTSVLDKCYILDFSGSSVENRFISEKFLGSADMWN